LWTILLEFVDFSVFVHLWPKIVIATKSFGRHRLAEGDALSHQIPRKILANYYSDKQDIN